MSSVRRDAQHPPAVDHTFSRRHLFWACAAVLLLAAALRLWDLGGLPPGLFRDEAEKGYTALELWRTGRHTRELLTSPTPEVSGPVPLFLDVGGVQTSAIYQYLSAPIVGMFGLSVMTTRLVAALAGVLTVLAAGWLARELDWNHGRDARATLLATLAAMAFVAFSPSHLLFSRWAQQGITVPLFATVGLVLALRVLRAEARHQRALATLCGLAFAVAFYAYTPAKLVVPALLLVLAWELWPVGFRRLLRLYWPGAVLFLLLAVPVACVYAATGTARLQRIGVLSQHDGAEGIARVGLNYLRHFDPRFLFITGDANPRHGLPLGGLMAWLEAPFFLLGAWSCLRSLRSQAPGGGARLLLGWVLVAPLAASLTDDGIPHALRSILFLPAVHLVSARGVLWLAERLGWERALALLAVERTVALALAVVALFVLLPKQWEPWQAGMLEALGRLEEINPGGPNVLSAEVPYAPYYVLFHEATNPAALQRDGLEATRVEVLMPGSKLPAGAWVARPATNLFERAQPQDILAPGAAAEDTPLMLVRPGW